MHNLSAESLVELGGQVVGGHAKRTALLSQAQLQLRLARCQVVADTANGRDALQAGLELIAGLGEQLIVVGAQLDTQRIN